jgi:hypothetical protein
VIHVQPKPTPPDPAKFDRKVRQPGLRFLESTPRPIASGKWKPSWRHAIPDLRKAYDSICSYTGFWISPATGAATVDHFRPKVTYNDSDEAFLAYEWTNFRLSCALANSNKGDFEDVLDPFGVENGWFIIDFATLQVEPGPRLSSELRRNVISTISRLKLNEDQKYFDERISYLEEYGLTNSFDFLKRRAPFLAYELERQGLIEEIKTIWSVERIQSLYGDRPYE